MSIAGRAAMRAEWRAARLGILFGLLVLCVACRPHAPKVADPRSPDERAWDAVHTLEGEENLEAAAAGYRGLCEQQPPYVRACFDLARVLYRLRSPEAAREVSVRTLLKYSEEGFAPSLVKRLAQSLRDTGEWDAGIAELEKLAEQLKDSEIFDTILFAAARLARDGGDGAAEERLLRRIVASHDRWESQLWDDAVWRLSQICREGGRTDDELQWLGVLLNARESSRLLGSYNSPHHDDALYRAAQIHLERQELKSAYRLFLELSKISSARLSDEGLVGAAEAAEAMGRVSKACELLMEAVEKDGTAKRDALRKALSLQCEE